MKSIPDHLAAHILVFEDEPDLLDAMVRYLQLDGYVTYAAANLQAAEHWLTQRDMDIIVLDLGLPDGDGLNWLNLRPGLREMGVIMTTARAEGSSRVSGVRAGADVYLVKPVELEELSALVRNLLHNAIRHGMPGSCVIIRTSPHAGQVQPMARIEILNPIGAMLPDNDVKGFGLGLKFVKTTIQRHDGKFHLQIPYQEVDDHMAWIALDIPLYND